jgi:hypothetical protein
MYLFPEDENAAEVLAYKGQVEWWGWEVTNSMTIVLPLSTGAWTLGPS